MNKIKSLMKNTRTAIGDTITSYHARIARMSLDKIKHAELNGDIRTKMHWEGVYIEHASKVPELKDDFVKWLYRSICDVQRVRLSSK